MLKKMVQMSQTIPTLRRIKVMTPIKYDASDEKNILTTLFKYDALDSFRLVLWTVNAAV